LQEGWPRAYFDSDQNNRGKEAAVTKYLLLYRSSVSAADQMANATPEQAQAGMDAWMTWGGKAGSAIVDMGSPTQSVATVGGDAGSDSGFIGGYSVMEAGSLDELKGLLDGHPHLMMDGAAIEVLELLPVPGM
jgi:hypothetical protein